MPRRNGNISIKPNSKISRPDAENYIDADTLDSDEAIRSFQIQPIPVNAVKNNKYVPPLRTLSLAERHSLVREFPEAILKKLRGRKPNQSLIRHGVPKKVTMSPFDIDEFSLISSYMATSTAKVGGYFMELTVPYDTQLFWLCRVVYRPNKPYMVIIAAEDDGPAANLLAAYLISYYRDLQGGSLGFTWYRSLEFVSMKQARTDQSVAIIQCRHPSWVETPKQLLRTIQNARAVFENTLLILTLYEEDLHIVPYLMADEPLGVFFKVGVGNDLLTINKPQPALWRRSLKKVDKDG